MRRGIHIRILKNIFLSLSLLLIGVNFVAYVFFRSAGQADKVENRTKAAFPKFDPKEKNKFFGEVESYFSDYFPFKYNYIGDLNSAKHWLFNSSNASDKVIYGKNNWEFYNATYMDSTGLMDEFCGLRPWPANHINTLLTNIRYLRDWCSKHNVLFLTVICPNKQSVYPELLPDVYKQCGDDNYDQLMKADSSLINLKKILLAEKSATQYPLYFSKDTHWNLLGGYLGVAEVSKVLHGQFSYIPVLSLADVSVSSKDTVSATDLGNMAVLDDAKDQGRVDVKLNKVISQKIGKLFILHDSYYLYLKPTLSQLFDTIVDMDTYSFSRTPKELLNIKPQVFIYEVVERYKDRLMLDESYMDSAKYAQLLQSQAK